MEKEFDIEENGEWQKVALDKLKGVGWAEMLCSMMKNQPLKDFNELMTG